jgi:hypothetical protein
MDEGSNEGSGGLLWQDYPQQLGLGPTTLLTDIVDEPSVPGETDVVSLRYLSIERTVINALQAQAVDGVDLVPKLLECIH